MDLQLLPQQCWARLYEIVESKFATFEPFEQAGPLFLKLLLGHLVLSNDANEAALVSTVFNFSIKDNHKTKEIYEFSHMLSSITETIVAIRDHKEAPLPDEYLQHITGIFQTTSVTKFNRILQN